MTVHQSILAGAEGARTPTLISEVMEEYGGAVRTVMDDYLTPEGPAPYLHDLVVDYPRRGGKMMRPSLCIAHARAFGATMEQAVLTAAAIELLHNALLIHDDIEDGSEERRGRPTLHMMHGVPLALNAGDTLMLLSLRPLMDNISRLGDRLALEIFRETAVMAQESAEGQALELGWRDLNDTAVTEADYLKMVLKKTAWLSTIFPARVGALIGSDGRIDPSIFMAFGFFLGAAFQIQDDLLNLTLSPTYGKEHNGDLYEGKRTLMLIHAHRSCSPSERARLDRFLTLGRDQRTAEQVGWLRGVMERRQSMEYARTVAEALVGAASYEFSRVYDGLSDSRDKRFIAALIPWVFERG